jgi:glycosyltransferase involved in cell wall biosynthesis
MQTAIEPSKNRLTPGLLTIAVPSYNGAHQFAALFQSIQLLGLNASEYEVLVVDNCSTDQTQKEILELQKRMPNLRYHRNEVNIGRIENWNRAIELAKGEFLILMNVNDRFLDFEAWKYIHCLIRHRSVSLILTDMQMRDQIYPAWLESGQLKLKDYLKKTFLEPNYLEFHSVGILHQHIFRTQLIIDHSIRFDPSLPRTTDRVFVGQVIEAGGGGFYYINKPMVKWQPNNNRYHHHTHNDKDNFNFQELWGNEYRANLQLAQLAEIPFHEFLKSQLTLTSSYIFKKKLRTLRKKLSRKAVDFEGLEFPTSSSYYQYLSEIAKSEKIPLNFFSIQFTGFWLVLKEYLIWHKIMRKQPRTLSEIIHINTPTYL